MITGVSMRIDADRLIGTHDLSNACIAGTIHTDLQAVRHGTEHGSVVIYTSQHT